ncbi:fibronectin type III domain protein [Ulvibacter sp. MAR_2010_11]|uniref:fibronectin type III domain-containing protein n=1 Tax=Ulvibacter sp. MAR_2010_11 TaxID=1250229 RepID=UPI000CC14D01|nr:fibronectin type III domain-containing protein [Ulvibacter sp. MAR_2010_11]PKA82713.1 fibronectin type III domain protein [Ulvibacter sp. MAR_2010_11]
MKKLFLVLLLVATVISCKKDDDGGNNNCPKPASISAIQINSTSIFFEWDATNGTAWQFEYGPTGFQLGNGTVVSTSQVNYLINGLTPSTAYTIYLRNNCGSGGFSEYRTFDFITSEPAVSCNAPTNLQQTQIGSTFIDITWVENNETAWQVEYGSVGHPVGSGTTEDTSQSNYRIDNLTPSTTYEIYVRANCGSDGYSTYTPALVITTNN